MFDCSGAPLMGILARLGRRQLHLKDHMRSVNISACEIPSMPIDNNIPCHTNPTLAPASSLSNKEFTSIPTTLNSWRSQLSWGGGGLWSPNPRKVVINFGKL